MKTTEFRCEKCSKLLAKLTGDGHFMNFSTVGNNGTIEMKCPRCKTFNRKELNIEALEAHNRVSRHGDNV